MERRVNNGPIRRILRRADIGVGVALYFFAGVLLVLASWATIANVAKSGWGSNAAAWAQAAGSIAAITGAAWLSQSEARRARRQLREQNEEAAWQVRFVIRQAQFESQIIAAQLTNRSKPLELSDIREWRQRTVTSCTGLSSFMGRTQHIHPSIVHFLANAKVLMDDLSGDLARLRRIVRKGRSPELDLVGRIVAPHRALLELLENFDASMRGVRLALDEGHDALPIGKWTNWTPEQSNKSQSRDPATP